MSAPSAVLRRTSRVTATPPSTPPRDLVRALFRIGSREQAAQLAKHAATLAGLDTTSRAHATSRERAVAALHMYRAREAIEEIENAIVHLGDGTSAARPPLGPDAADVVVTALRGLAQRGDVKVRVVAAAIEQFDVELTR